MAERKYYRKTYQKTKKRRGLFFILKFFVFCFLFFVFFSLALFIFYAKDLPRPEKFAERQLPQTTKIYDRTGEILLYEIYGEEKKNLGPFS